MHARGGCGAWSPAGGRSQCALCAVRDALRIRVRADHISLLHPSARGGALVRAHADGVPSALLAVALNVCVAACVYNTVDSLFHRCRRFFCAGRHRPALSLAGDRWFTEGLCGLEAAARPQCDSRRSCSGSVGVDVWHVWHFVPAWVAWVAWVAAATLRPWASVKYGLYCVAAFASKLCKLELNFKLNFNCLLPACR